VNALLHPKGPTTKFSVVLKSKKRKITAMNFENTRPGFDLEGNARESAGLEVGLKMPEIKSRPMPVMSDLELYFAPWCA
jgi:hypothetical protein